MKIQVFRYKYFDAYCVVVARSDDLVAKIILTMDELQDEIYAFERSYTIPSRRGKSVEERCQILSDAIAFGDHIASLERVCAHIGAHGLLENSPEMIEKLYSLSGTWEDFANPVDLSTFTVRLLAHEPRVGSHPQSRFGGGILGVRGARPEDLEVHPEPQSAEDMEQYRLGQNSGVETIWNQDDHVGKPLVRKGK